MVVLVVLAVAVAGTDAALEATVTGTVIGATTAAAGGDIEAALAVTAAAAADDDDDEDIEDVGTEEEATTVEEGATEAVSGRIMVSCCRCSRFESCGRRHHRSRNHHSFAVYVSSPAGTPHYPDRPRAAGTCGYCGCPHRSTHRRHRARLALPFLPRSNHRVPGIRPLPVASPTPRPSRRPVCERASVCGDAPAPDPHRT
uniref:Putative secreted protein n=1 Tax=Anopheles darlingi TaxID=43151 RepID=A0A2M4DPI4_ANODA